MYIPPAFEERDPEVLRRLIRAHPLATLVTAGARGLEANLVPFTLVEHDGGDRLRAHLAMANGQVESLREGGEALVIFQGAEVYITPSWYATKAEHGRVVPTWNYVVVQVRGAPTVIDDASWLRSQLDALTREQERNRPEPWRVDDAPSGYVSAQLKGIVGVEIPVLAIQGKWKVSQNQPVINRKSLGEGLQREGASEMAALVEARSRGASLSGPQTCT